MKLVLNINFKGNNIQLDILSCDLIKIDEFTTSFDSKNELLKEILNYSNKIKIDDIDSYNIFIKYKDGYRQVIYSDYRFITDFLLRRNARICLMHMDKDRISSYIENFYYSLIFDEKENSISNKYVYKVIRELYEIIDDKNFKYDSNYYNFFIQKIEPYYNILRDFIIGIFEKEEKDELNKRDDRPINKKLYECEYISRRLDIEIMNVLDNNKKIQKNSNTENKLINEDYVELKEKTLGYDDWYIPDET